MEDHELAHLTDAERMQFNILWHQGTSAIRQHQLIESIIADRLQKQRVNFDNELAALKEQPL
jgi:stress-induced morphogen